MKSKQKVWIAEWDLTYCFLFTNVLPHIQHLHYLHTSLSTFSKEKCIFQWFGTCMIIIIIHSFWHFKVFAWHLEAWPCFTFDDSVSNHEAFLWLRQHTGIINDYIAWILRFYCTKVKLLDQKIRRWGIGTYYHIKYFKKLIVEKNRKLKLGNWNKGSSLLE